MERGVFLVADYDDVQVYSPLGAPTVTLERDGVQSRLRVRDLPLYSISPVRHATQGGAT